jgi:hypothetical protein
MRSRGIGSLIVVVALVVGACTDDAPATSDTSSPPDIRPPCTLIGCASGVFWRIDESVSEGWPRPVTFEACVDDHCEQTEITANQMVGTHRTAIGLYDGIDLESEHTATVRVTAPDGAVLLEREDVVTLSSHQPNGPSCPPTCWQATVHVDSVG